MKIADINPHVRCAERFVYRGEETAFYVKDCRIFYILRGEGEIEILGARIPLRQESLFYCAGDSVYTVRAERPLEMIALNFDLSQKARRFTLPLVREEAELSKNKIPSDKRTVEDSSFLNTFYLVENATEHRSVLWEAVKEFEARRPLFRESAGVLLKGLLIDLHRLSEQKNAGAADAVAETVDYIASHYAHPIKNKELAHRAGYHEYYLNRIFLRQTGMSIHRYVLLLRIEEAKKLLTGTALPLSRIATAVGFHSGTHFATYFKREVGISPSEYRACAQR